MNADESNDAGTANAFLPCPVGIIASSALAVACRVGGVSVRRLFLLGSSIGDGASPGTSASPNRLCGSPASGHARRRKVGSRPQRRRGVPSLPILQRPTDQNTTGSRFRYPVRLDVATMLPARDTVRDRVSGSSLDVLPVAIGHPARSPPPVSVHHGVAPFQHRLSAPAPGYIGRAESCRGGGRRICNRSGGTVLVGRIVGGTCKQGRSEEENFAHRGLGREEGCGRVREHEPAGTCRRTGRHSQPQLGSPGWAVVGPERGCR